MAKKTIGYFTVMKKIFNITYRKGYKKQDKYVYIENWSKGILFKFRTNYDGYVFINNGPGTTPTTLYIKDSDIDIAEILQMVFKPRAYKLTSLSMMSRMEIIEEVVLEGI